MPKEKKSPDTASDELVEETLETVQQDDENWQERYKGMQRAFNTQKQEYEKLRAAQDALLESSETSKANESELQKQLEANQKMLDEQQQALDNMTGQLAAQEAKMTRQNLILSEFPDLAPFEAKKLLPDVPIGENFEDDMKTRFAEFREVYNNTIKSEVKKQVTGAGATETGVSGEKITRSKAYIYNRLQQLAGSNRPEERREYDELLAEWDEAVALEIT